MSQKKGCLMGIITKLFPLGGNTAPTQNERFVFEIETSYSRQPFSVGTTAVASQIDWGDGSVENFEAGVRATHAYTTPGTYIVYYRPTEYKIRSDFFSDSYPNMVTRYLTPLPQCVGADGTPSITLGRSYSNFHNALKQVPNDFFKSNTQIQNLLYFFAGSKLPAIPDGIFDGLVNLRNVGGLFWASKIQRILYPPFTKEKHPNLTNIAGVFGGCGQLTDICDYLFYTLDGVTNIDQVFYNTTNLESIPPHTFPGNNTNSILSCRGAFSLSGIKSFEQEEAMFGNIGSSGAWDYLFEKCPRLTSIPENLFEGATMHSMDGRNRIFQNSTALETVPANLFNNAELPKDVAGAFEGCTALKEIPEGFLDKVLTADDEINVGGMFQGCTSLTTIPANLLDSIPTEKTLSKIEVGSMFKACTGLTSIPEGFLSTLAQTRCNIISMNMMFDGCENLTGNAPEYWNVVNQSSATPIGYDCFRGCTNLSNYDSIPENWK